MLTSYLVINLTCTAEEGAMFPSLKNDSHNISVRQLTAYSETLPK